MHELDPSRLVTRLDAALAALEERREELNGLNVFPVADGDTGDNLTLTVRAVRDAAAELAAAGSGAQPSPEETSTRLARSALLGARGNSGVILAQWLRGAAAGFSQAAAGASAASVPVAAVLHAGARAARAAVSEPAPGTVLSVMDALAEGAGGGAGVGEAPDAQLERALDAGWTALERGRHELEALRRADVVDAGGLGLLVLVSGALSAGRDGRELSRAASPGGRFAPTRHPGVPDRHRHCLNLVLSKTALESAALASRLEGLGDSLVVIGDPPDLRVHIHTDDPQGVVAACGAEGVVERVEVDDMVSQASLRAPA